MSEGTIKRKLIEVALPLEAINRESAREKSIRHGHPSTLHLWWARRLLAEAHAEILKSTDGNLPAILDPFAGGGSIPLEAQRLGLEARASDLNPVAVLINKSLIEIPPLYAAQPPVSPGALSDMAGATDHWPRATGHAEDVRRCGRWMRDEAEKRIGHLYPKAEVGGKPVNVIAWIWARTITCPNPACGDDIPLASTWWLSKKRNRPTWIQPVVTGKHVDFEIRVDTAGPPDPPKQGRGAKLTCLVCHDTTTDTYVKAEAMAGRMGARLLSVVAEGKRKREYLPASAVHVEAADVQRPTDVPEERLAIDPRNIWCVSYGLTKSADLFTNRQLVALTTFSDLVGEARDRVAADADAKEAGHTPEQAEVRVAHCRRSARQGHPRRWWATSSSSTRPPSVARRE